jgi:hypothetical protein
LGLCADWKLTEELIIGKKQFPIGWVPEPTVIVKKNVVIVIEKLPNYKKDPPKKFWDSFPKKPMPTAPSCSVDVERLNDVLESHATNISKSSFDRAKRVIRSLKKGAP